MSEAKGKEKIGKATGNERLQDEGVANKAEGTVERGVGKIKETVEKLTK